MYQQTDLSEKFQEALADLLGLEASDFLNNYAEETGLTEDERTYGIVRVNTYSEIGVPTADKGLVVQLANGSEIRLTIRACGH